MRIGILQGAFLPVPPLRGGAVEKMWFLLGQEFARCGHEVVHVSRRFPGLPDRETIHGVSHIRVGGFDTPRSMLRLKLYDLLFSVRALRALPRTDILVTNTFWSPVLAAPFRKVYVDVQRMPKGQIKLYRQSAVLRANSSPVRDAIAAEDASAAGRISLIPNPLPFIPATPPDFAAKEKLLLFVGRIHPEKGIELLLEAFLLAKSRGALAGWKLNLVGPESVAAGGGGEEWAGALRRKYPHEDITWVGPIFDDAALNAQYQRASLFLYPSLAEQGETFGLAPLEAMAWGTVPVVSQLRCFQDFILPGTNGFIFDHRVAQPATLLADTLDAASRAPLETLGRAAVEVRETHSVQKIGAEFLDDFARVIGGK